MRTAPALLLFLAVPAAAQMSIPIEAPGKPNPAVATPGKYKIEPTHTQALFTVTHLGWTNYTGQFTNPTGTLTLDTKRPARSKVSVIFAIDKVLTTVPDLDAHLKGPEFFDAAKFPTATFTSTSVTPTGPMTATIAGTLSLHGVTKPVVLKTRFIGAGKQFWGEKKMALGFAATTSIKRSDFGVNSNLGLVSDKVDLVINAAFEAQ
jgi:polyisoprenoid-binding protein YceI